MDNKCVKENFPRLIIILAVVVFGFASLAYGAEYSLITNEFRADAAIRAAETSLSDEFPPAQRWRTVTLTPLIATPDGLAQGDTLTLNLFDDKVYTARIDRVSVNVNGTVTVRGRIEGYSLGYVLISTTGDCSLGSVRIPEKGEYYVIQSQPDAKQHYLLDVNIDQLEELEDGPTPIPPSPTPQKAAEMEMLAGTLAGGPLDPATIDVMIVYTPAARLWADSSGGGIANVIAQAMGNAQLALNNSNTILTMNLVYSAEVSYTESGSSDTDLDRLTYTDDGYMDGVHTWRNQYGADLVTLFARVEDVGGISWLLNTTSGLPQYGFSLVRVQQAAGPTYSPIHEIGHNMGCDHYKWQVVSPGPGLFSYSAGWRWVVSSLNYCSVMSYTVDGSYSGTRLPYFSNPSIYDRGVATGDATNGDNARTIRETKFVVAAYRQLPGSLRVTISPQGAIDAGAQWRRTGTSAWWNSGDTESGIPAGQYTVEFKDITGWNKPSNQGVIISDGQTTNASGIYTIILPTGSLCVTISPQGAIDAGAQWRRVGTSAWLNSGNTESDIPVGQYAVEFKDITSWNKPSEQGVMISDGQTTNASGTYTIMIGSLCVTISPQGVIDAGAQWRRTGTSAWWNSGDTESSIPVGQYTVEFKDIAGWDKPSNQDITISEGLTTNAGGTYVQQGYLIIYVNINATGADNGSSWADAYTSLQSALSAAVGGDEIWVAGGTYKPTTDIDRTISFVMKQGVAVYGGFDETETNRNQRDWVANETILSGDINTPGDNSDNSYQVVTGANSSVLNGFTITGGNAEGNYGGGMYNHNSFNVKVTNCTFSGNQAWYYGGGMCNDSSSPTITNCTFIGNSAYYYGGGMCNYHSSPTVTNCTFSGNSANYYGGGMANRDYSSPTVTNCTFSGNSANWGGGGMRNESSSPAVTNCIFIGNTANGGGGMSNHGSSLMVTNCTFSGNTATYYGGDHYYGGGGMSNIGNSPIVTNCTFSGNSAYADGGGMYNQDSSPTLTNCTFSDNISQNGPALACYHSSHQSYPSSVTMANCIIWNGPDWLWNNDNFITITYSDVEGGWTGTGNIDTDPCFVDPNGPDGIAGTDDDNLRLLSGSPCIDAGNNDSVPPDYADLDGDSNTTEPTPLDLDNFPRFRDGDCNGSNIVDMGAYEFSYAYIGDFDNQCDVDFQDFAILADAWLIEEGQTGYNPICDISQPINQRIDMSDLEIFCEHWLWFAGI